MKTTGVIVGLWLMLTVAQNMQVSLIVAIVLVPVGIAAHKVLDYRLESARLVRDRQLELFDEVTLPARF